MDEFRHNKDDRGHTPVDATQDFPSSGTSEVETSQPGPSTSSPVRDTRFYIEPVVFQVGNTIFKVAKDRFMVFEAMFALPLGKYGANREGSNDENPIHLRGVEESQFRAFLTILYPSAVDATMDLETRYGILIGGLDLATRWDFADLRKNIISELSPTIVNRDKQEVAYIAKGYRVAHWLRMTYKKLVDPSFELPITELTSSPYPLDWETTTKVYFIRETLIRGSLNGNSHCAKCGYYGPSYSDARYLCECRIWTLIDTQFQEELESMSEYGPEPFYHAEVSTASAGGADSGKKKKKKK